jgi:hypothetical protein
LYVEEGIKQHIRIQATAFDTLRWHLHWKASKERADTHCHGVSSDNQSNQIR